MTLDQTALTTHQARRDYPAGDALTDETPLIIKRPQVGAAARRATVIVFGNGKGGTGKSTAAMHVIVGLLRDGYRVGAIDLDAQQGTLTRYFDNRRLYAKQQAIELPQPLYRTVGRSELHDRKIRSGSLRSSPSWTAAYSISKKADALLNDANGPMFARLRYVRTLLLPAQ